MRPTGSLLLLLATAAVGPACPAPAPQPPATDSAAEVTLHGVRMELYRGEELGMVGLADRVEYERDSADVRGRDAVLRFPSGRTGPRAPGMAVAGLEVRAPRVAGNLYARRATADGGVVLRTAGGLVGHTEQAAFDGVQMKVHGQAPVEVSGPGYRMQAGGFTFSFLDETFTFLEGTQTVLGEDAQ